jgi:amidase
MTADADADWQIKAAAKRKQRDALLPPETRVNVPADLLDVSGVPASSGVLSPEDIEITEAPSVTALLVSIHSKRYTSEQVVRAFCRRAAVAQQLVRRWWPG